MHGDDLVVLLRRDEGEGIREAELEADEPGQDQRHQADRGRGQRILDGDDFGVLREDVFRDPAMGMIKLDLFHLCWRNVVQTYGVMCDIGHKKVP